MPGFAVLAARFETAAEPLSEGTVPSLEISSVNRTHLNSIASLLRPKCKELSTLGWLRRQLVADTQRSSAAD